METNVIVTADWKLISEQSSSYYKSYVFTFCFFSYFFKSIKNKKINIYLYINDESICFYKSLNVGVRSTC